MRAVFRNSGEEPHIECVQTPPCRAELVDLITRANLTPRGLSRRKGAPYGELGRNDPSLTDEQLIDALRAHPIQIKRPRVVTPLGVRLCRPPEVVLDILPNLQSGSFAKEDGETVVDESRQRAR